MITAPTYATREDIKAALDVKETARNNDQIDRVLDGAARVIESNMQRIFYPRIATKYFDWPNFQYARAWRVWFDANDVISITTLTSGTTTIPAANYNLEPANYGPPYTWMEIKLSTSSAFSAGSSFQRSVRIDGLFGYSNDETTAGALAEDLDVSETGVDVTNSALIGVGDLIRVGTERMLVTGKTMLDTGVNIDAADSLTASAADVSLTLSTTTGAPATGEMILIDSERMLVTDIAGTVATVKRAWDGSVLAAHAANADIYAPRTLTVVRGAYGTTAATATTSTAIARWVPPAPIRTLAIAETVNALLQEMSGYARTTQSGRGGDSGRIAALAGLSDLRAQTYSTCGRKARKRAV